MDYYGGPKPLRSNWGATAYTVRVTRSADDLRRQVRESQPPKAERRKTKADKRAERLVRTAERIDRAAAERHLAGTIRMGDF